MAYYLILISNNIFKIYLLHQAIASHPSQFSLFEMGLSSARQKEHLISKINFTSTIYFRWRLEVRRGRANTLSRKGFVLLSCNLALQVLD